MTGGASGLRRRLAAWWAGRRVRWVRGPEDLEDGAVVRFTGVAVGAPPLVEPLERMACVAAVYRAWPPATTVGVDGATAHGSRAFEVRVEAFAPFEVGLFGRTVRVRPQREEDLEALHAELLEAHGIRLRCEVVAIPDRCPVEVSGTVRRGRSVRGSPHRVCDDEVVVDLDALRALAPIVTLPRPAP